MGRVARPELAASAHAAARAVGPIAGGAAAATMRTTGIGVRLAAVFQTGVAMGVAAAATCDHPAAVFACVGRLWRRGGRQRARGTDQIVEVAAICTAVFVLFEAGSVLATDFQYIAGDVALFLPLVAVELRAISSRGAARGVLRRAVSFFDEAGVCVVALQQLASVAIERVGQAGGTSRSAPIRTMLVALALDALHRHEVSTADVTNVLYAKGDDGLFPFALRQDFITLASRIAGVVTEGARFARLMFRPNFILTNESRRGGEVLTSYLSLGVARFTGRAWAR